MAILLISCTGAEQPATPSAFTTATTEEASTPIPTSTPGTPSKPLPDSSSHPRPAGLKGKVVVLDPGHNGLNGRYPARLGTLVPAGGFRKPCNTTGTQTNAGYPEHAFTFDVAERAALILGEHGVTVRLTRPDDLGFGPCVNERAAIGNDAHAEVAVSIHADGAKSTGRGFHVIAPALAPDRGNSVILASSDTLATDLRSAFRAHAGIPYADYTAKSGLIHRSDLAGLNLSRIPAVFIECGNMRNALDAELMTSRSWRQRAAEGIVAGIEAFLRA